ncbi:MAG TPA: hypothetical protein VFG80_06015 [Myxococcota bacterium]|nr:hypothetical protein [Myxococcota bacterium]
MKPDVDRTLQLLAQSLLLELGPGLANDYAQKSALLAALLLSSAAEEWDRAAERRAEENRALRELFRAVTERGVEDAALRDRLDAAARATDASLRVSELERANAELRALLIELHAHVEEVATPDAREIEARIWDELRRSTERRRLSMQPF